MGCQDRNSTVGILLMTLFVLVIVKSILKPVEGRITASSSNDKTIVGSSANDDNFDDGERTERELNPSDGEEGARSRIGEWIDDLTGYLGENPDEIARFRIPGSDPAASAAENTLSNSMVHAGFESEEMSPSSLELKSSVKGEESSGQTFGTGSIFVGFHSVETKEAGDASVHLPTKSESKKKTQKTEENGSTKGIPSPTSSPMSTLDSTNIWASHAVFIPSPTSSPVGTVDSTNSWASHAVLEIPSPTASPVGTAESTNIWASHAVLEIPSPTASPVGTVESTSNLVSDEDFGVGYATVDWPSESKASSQMSKTSAGKNISPTVELRLRGSVQKSTSAQLSNEDRPQPPRASAHYKFSDSSSKTTSGTGQGKGANSKGSSKGKANGKRTSRSRSRSSKNMFEKTKAPAIEPTLISATMEPTPPISPTISPRASFSPNSEATSTRGPSIVATVTSAPTSLNAPDPRPQPTAAPTSFAPIAPLPSAVPTNGIVTQSPTTSATVVPTNRLATDSPTAMPARRPTPEPALVPTFGPQPINPRCVPTVGGCLETEEELAATLAEAPNGSVVGMCGGNVIEISSRLRITSNRVTFCCATADRSCTLQSTGQDLILEASGVSLEIRDITFLDGSNAGGNGGNVSFRGFGDPHRIDQCNFHNGQSEQGGNVFVRTTGAIIVRGSSFTDGTAASNGGGLAIDGATEVTVRDSTFSGNTAGAEGGGMFAARLETKKSQIAVIQDSTFQANTAINGGGFAVSELGSLSVLTTEFVDNSATERGGAGAMLELVDGTALKYQGNTGSENTAGSTCPDFLTLDPTSAVEVCVAVDQDFP